MNNFQKRQKKKKNLKKSINNERRKNRRLILEEFYQCRFNIDIGECVANLVRAYRYPSRRGDLGYSDDPCEFDQQFSRVFLFEQLRLSSFISKKVGKKKLQELSISEEDLNDIAGYFLESIILEGELIEEEEECWDTCDDFY